MLNRDSIKKVYVDDKSRIKQIMKEIRQELQDKERDIDALSGERGDVNCMDSTVIGRQKQTRRNER